MDEAGLLIDLAEGCLGAFGLCSSEDPAGATLKLADFGIATHIRWSP